MALDRGSEGKPSSYVLHKATGHNTMIHEGNGTFQFDLKAPRGKAVANVHESSSGAEGFPRPGSHVADLFY